MGMRASVASGEDDSGENAGEFARCGRRIARDTAIWLPMIDAGRRGAASRLEISDPCREPAVTKNAEAGWHS